MSDTQHDEAVHVDAEAVAERDRREARELAYQEVSLRAVELLASAQRAADEAVAEAQSYARDLEETAREQYRHILQRAHDAARAAGGEPAADDLPAGAAAVADAGSGLDGRQLEYVRTYARVAHTQLAAVLGALTDELDRLAELADGTSPSVADVLSEPPADERSEQEAAEEHDEHDPSGEDAAGHDGRDGRPQYHDGPDAHG